jgi:hypothetical protein
VVAGAPAQVALEPDAHFLFGRVRVLLQQAGGGHHHAGRAIAALQAVVLHERLLHRVHHAIDGHALDGGHLMAVDLYSQDTARLHAAPIEEHGARPAVAGVAPDHGAGLPQLFSEVVNEQGARLDIVGVALPVHGHADPGHAGVPSCRESRCRIVTHATHLCKR